MVQASSIVVPSELNDRRAGLDTGPRSSSSGNSVVTERLLYVHGERKCPVF